MATTIEELIKALKKKDQKKQVEFIICGEEGDIVCMNIEANAADMANALKLFGNKT